MKQKMIGAAAVLLAALALAGGSGQLAALDDFPAVASIAALGAQSETDDAAALTARTAGETPDFTKKIFASASAGENALRIAGVTVSLHEIQVEKTAGASAETAADGDGAALLVTGGAQATIRGAKISASVPGSQGAVGSGADTVLQLTDSSITTTGDRADGLQTADGATVTAASVTVTTAGDDSAAVRAGSGTLVLQGGVYTSGGIHAPAIYAGGTVSAQDATLTANNSEVLVLEGGQTLTLENCAVRGNMNGELDAAEAQELYNVRIYQTGDLADRQDIASLVMRGGSLSSGSGDLFYLTNVRCRLQLSGVSIEDAGSGVLLRVAGNDGASGWGQAGSNGALAEILAEDQTLEGDIVVDSISTMSLTLSGNSTLTGAIRVVDNAAGGSPAAENAVVEIGPGCLWSLTGDSTVSSLENNGTIRYNGHTITLADGTVLTG